jgi:exonuclease VII small subunit
MFILSANSAVKSLNAIISRLDSLQPRLDALAKIAEASEELGIDDGGTREHIDQLDGGTIKMEAHVRTALNRIHANQNQWREFVPLIKACRKELDAVEAHLGQIELAVSAAQANLQKHLSQTK